MYHIFIFYPFLTLKKYKNRVQDIPHPVHVKQMSLQNDLAHTASNHYNIQTFI